MAESDSARPQHPVVLTFLRDHGQAIGHFLGGNPIGDDEILVIRTRNCVNSDEALERIGDAAVAKGLPTALLKSGDERIAIAYIEDRKTALMRLASFGFTDEIEAHARAVYSVAEGKDAYLFVTTTDDEIVAATGGLSLKARKSRDDD